MDLEALQFTWRSHFINGEPLLGPILNQRIDVCWAIGIIREYEALLRLDGSIAAFESLSIQELVNLVANELLHYNGGIYKLTNAAGALLSHGTTYEHYVPLDYVLSHLRFLAPPRPRFIPAYVNIHLPTDPGMGNGNYDILIEHLLERSPVAVTLRMYPSYDDAPHDALLQPTEAEFAAGEDNIPPQLEPIYHVMLLTGRGILNGTPFLEMQDSYGLENGINGFVYFARYPCLVLEVVEIII